jgi:hypothetical protein
MSIQPSVLKEVEDLKKYENLQLGLRQAFSLLVEFYVIQTVSPEEFEKLFTHLKTGLQRQFMSFEEAEMWLGEAQIILGAVILDLLIKDEELRSGVKIEKEDVKALQPQINDYLKQKGERMEKELPELIKELQKEQEKENTPPVAAPPSRKSNESNINVRGLKGRQSLSASGASKRRN